MDNKNIPKKFPLYLPSGSIGWSIIQYIKRVAGLIPGEDTYLGFWFSSLVWTNIGGNQVDFSLSPPISFLSSLKN